MKLDFSAIPEVVMPCFKGGDKEALVRRYGDSMGGIVHITLPVGASIGVHTHEGNCEIVYVLSGCGETFDDGETYPISAGTVTYCPVGHTHGIRNTGNEPLVLLGILPDVK